MRCATVLVALLLAAPAAAMDRPTGWDGANPFACEPQFAGFGATVPQPDADPYCVEFDKREQNVSEAGVVEFLALEPARVSAAGPKCFYYQVDHWRGSIVQEDGRTKTYEWDGRYYFDKATGDGGIWVTNFNVNGRTGDPSQVPGLPDDVRRFFGPGEGGVRSRNAVPVDPRCVELARTTTVYRTQTAAGDPRPRCGVPTGDVSPRALGPVALGEGEASIRAALGRPVRIHRGFLRYCVRGGGKFLVGLPGDRSGAEGVAGGSRAVLLLTTHPAYRSRGVGRGAPARAVRRAFPHARRVTRMGRTVVWRAGRTLIGVRMGRVRFLAVHDPAAVRTVRDLRGWLRRSQ